MRKDMALAFYLLRILSVRYGRGFVYEEEATPTVSQVTCQRQLPPRLAERQQPTAATAIPTADALGVFGTQSPTRLVGRGLLHD
ncbi:hypothetical protein ON010_g17866 [Phytophthora cinnamomi]|nr:hypothetical protein ON010_g17866 [Phytophthora cinnamomi]